jgi:enterochelin esterase-like enzyme
MIWFNVPKTPQPGVEHKGYHSQAMNKEIGYNIYLPPGYEAGTKRYPVVYWLHGRNNTESSDYYPIGYLSQGIADGKLPPLILVYASGGSQTNYCDSYDGKYMAETTVIKELIPYIDKNYRTIASRSGRAIQGMSMGGFGAMRLALKYPDLFSSVVAFAGGYRWPEDMEDPPHPSYGEMFHNDPEIFRASHPETWARRNQEQIRGKLAIQIYVGDQDPGLKKNRRMHALLDELKIPHGYQEFPGIAHNLKLLAEQVRTENFQIAVRAFGGEQAVVADPWPKSAVMEPAVLAHALESPQPPTVLCVAFSVLYRSKHIVHAIEAGPGSKPEGLALLRKAVDGLPKDTDLVIYCGCCPMVKCPNVRPAYRTLKEMGFTRVRVVNIPTNMHEDWYSRNYPSEAGSAAAR